MTSLKTPVGWADAGSPTIHPLATNVGLHKKHSAQPTKMENFIENFGLYTNAPDGFTRLKELILGLAFEGKLVEQTLKSDSVLDKLELSANKIDTKLKYKKEKKLKNIDDDEIMFSIPSHWEWVRMGRIGHNHGQEKSSSDFSYIDVSAINNSTGQIETPEVLDSASAPSRARKIVTKGTVIYSTVRPYLLNIAIVQKEFNPKPIASTAFAIIHPYDVINEKYVYYYLRSPKFVEYVESVQKGVAYPAINDEKFYSSLFPLAPLEEQKRIVAKVDELMALCDQLETQQQQQANSLLKANTAAIHALLSAETGRTTKHKAGRQNPQNKKQEDFATARDGGSAENAGAIFSEAWERIANNFHTLYGNTLPMPPGEGRQKKHLVGLENLKELRKVISTLAVEGKLTLHSNKYVDIASIKKSCGDLREQYIHDKWMRKPKNGQHGHR